jgi:hypothetical protein
MIATVDAPVGIKSGTGVLSSVLSVVFHGLRGHWFASQHGF